jgi:hypothetical protein
MTIASDSDISSCTTNMKKPMPTRIASSGSCSAATASLLITCRRSADLSWRVWPDSRLSV